MGEKLAALMHEIWGDWMKYVFCQGAIRSGMLLISSEATTRWKRQMNTAYAALTEAEKDSDRRVADKVLELIESLNDEKRRWPL